MNLDQQPHKRLFAFTAMSWICAIGCLALVLAYLGWMTLGSSFAANQSRLHPVPVAQIIFDQVTQAAPPWDWNVPLWSIIVWFLWLIGTWGGGWLLLRWIWQGDPSTPHSVRAVLAFVVGFCAVGITQEILGLAGIVAFPLFILGDVALLLTLRISPKARSEFSEFGRAATWQWRASKASSRWLVTAFAIAAMFMLVPALTPPIQSDAVRYHLGAPQEYLKLGRITYLPLNAYSNMPFLVEMHFMSALASRAPEAAQLMHFTLAVLTVFAIYASLRLQQRSFSESRVAPPSLAACLASALYFFTPMSAVLATWPFTDHGISFMLIASLLAMFLCIRATAPRPHEWIVLGICLGGLIGTKYTMGPIALVILATALIARWRAPNSSRRLPTITGNAAIAGIACLCVGGIWFLKNLYFTGNPFYPLASSIFPGGDWTGINDKFLHSRAGLKGMGNGAAKYLAAPWNTTFHWIQFESHNPGATILLALWLAVCGLILCWKSPYLRERMAVAAVVFSTTIIWFFSYQSNRLLLPTIAAALCLTPISGIAARTVARRIVSAALIIACGAGLAWAIQWSWIATALSPRPLPYLLGEQDAASYRYKSLTYARAFDFLNQQVHPNEKVLLVGEHRIYGARFDAIWSDWFDTPALAIILRRENLKSTHDLLDYLRDHGINWLLINEAELEPQMEQSFHPWFTPSEWQIFEELRILDGPGIDRMQFPPGVTVIHLEPMP